MSINDIGSILPTDEELIEQGLPVCGDCKDTGKLTVGRYCDIREVDCACQSDRKSQREADGLEDANIVG